MSRPIFVGNGSMLVGLGADGLVHDFYYPYVGLENHTSGQDLYHRVGVFVDGRISWLDEEEWETKLDYEPPALIGRVSASNPRLQLKLEFVDFVDPEMNVFARRIQVGNRSAQKREIRIFMNQIFRIGDSQRDDTALYLPAPPGILHYKGRRVFLVSGELADAASFDQYAIGLHGIEGHEGTFKDAEDGELSDNAIEHGRVDSTLRFKLEVDSQSSAIVNYWIAAAASRTDAVAAHAKFAGGGLEERLEATRDHWREWQMPATGNLAAIEGEFRPSAEKSLLIIKSHVDRRGAVIASGDSEMLNYSRDYYSYCWPRDSVYALWPLVRLGFTAEAKNFFEFARDTLQPDGYLMHKYQPDRAIGSSWHPYVRDGHEELPIQEDETASVIFLLGEYLKATQDVDFTQGLYETLVQPAANFLDSYIDSPTKLPHASYDLWEEKFLTTTYTTGLVYASLLTAADLADKFEFPDDAIRWRSVADDIRLNARDAFFNHDKGYFYKGFLLSDSGMMEYDSTIDASSLYGAVMFGLYELDDPLTLKAAATLESELLDKSASKGLPRYGYDHYHSTRSGSLGNPWFVTTLWFAQYLIEAGESDRAREILRWVQGQMLDSGVLPEQIDPDNGRHLSVAPLIWSSAEFINTLLDLNRV